MKLRLVQCFGGGRDHPHFYSVEGDDRPRCSACHDIAYTEEVGGLLLSRNRFGKLVDRKPLPTGPRAAYPDQSAGQGYLGYTVYSGFGVR